MAYANKAHLTPPMSFKLCYVTYTSHFVFKKKARGEKKRKKGKTENSLNIEN
jgi:hypothetical protein